MAIIFLSGMPRSGSTWLGEILGRSKSLNCIHGEPFNPTINKQYFAYDIKKWFVALKNSDFEAEQLDYVLCQRFSVRYLRRLFSAAVESNSGFGGYLRAIKIIFKRILFYLSSKPIFFKDPIAFFSTEFIHNRYNARVIILVRHPGAIINSFLRVNWDFHLGIFDNIEFNKEALGFLKLLKERFCKEELTRLEQIEKLALVWNIFYAHANMILKINPKWILLKHEDISISPIESIQSLFKQLKIDLNDEVQCYIHESTNPTNPGRAMGEVVHQLKRNSLENTSSWKNQFTKKELDLIDSTTKDVREVYGY